jgi:large subunit ribosomal protein L9
VKVLLRDDVESVGRKGDVVDVADGFARNYLVPQGLAIAASKGATKQAEAMRRNREAREVRDREAAQELAGRLGSTTISVGARAGEGGKLFGSVTSTDIAHAVRAALDVEIDRRTIELGDPLKELGPVEVPVRLHPDVVATLRVEVVAEQG